jgi:hypothetical protein
MPNVDNSVSAGATDFHQQSILPFQVFSTGLVLSIKILFT